MRQQNHKMGKLRHFVLCVCLAIARALRKSHQLSKLLSTDQLPILTTSVLAYHWASTHSPLTNVPWSFHPCFHFGFSRKNSADSRKHISLSIFAPRPHTSNSQKQLPQSIWRRQKILKTKSFRFRCLPSQRHTDIHIKIYIYIWMHIIVPHVVCMCASVLGRVTETPTCQNCLKKKKK